MFAAAPTDNVWYEYQKSHGYIDYINFWTPTDWKFKALKPGDRFVFKLKGSGDYAGGYGSFVEYKYQTLDESWNEFGRKNGFDSKSGFISGVGNYQKQSTPSCGCIVLKDVVYFDEPVKLSDYGIDFSRYIVTFKTYSTSFPFDDISAAPSSVFTLVKTKQKRIVLQKSTQREGQGEFHAAISMAYGNRCCISGETTPELLQAAHIQDYINKDSNHVQNGLLLRIDLHKLFDSGLLYIDDHYVVHVSGLVTSPEYRQFDGKKISLPLDSRKHPSLVALKFKEDSFRG